jgi:hypothetical protein
LDALPLAFLDMTLPVIISYSLILWCSPTKPIALSAIILGLVMVGRAAFVFPLSFLSNLSKKRGTSKDLHQATGSTEFFLFPNASAISIYLRWR